MPLPEKHPLSEFMVSASGPSVVAATGNAATVAPFRGRVIKVGFVHGGTTTATAAATITPSIAGTAITGGVLTVPNGTAAGTVITAVPTGANTCNEGDPITFVVSGTATAGTNTTLFAVIRRE
jgi:hypothetical protein